jgi:single-stranded-DNA-specific exonuclease
MNTYKWKPISDTPKDIKEAKEFLLSSRKMDPSLIDNAYSLKDILKNPSKLSIQKESIKEFSKVLLELVAKNKGVVIHGDYDVDGITSTVIFYEALQNIGFSKDLVKTIIPNRFDHGYGFSTKSFKEIKNNFPPNDFPLIVLVDCGITANETIKTAKKEGYKVVIVDHHQKQKTLPAADILFWNDKITASALSYFVCKYLEITAKNSTKVDNGVDLAALGYVCDLGDLSTVIGNTLTKEGIAKINNSPRAGIKSLLGEGRKKIKSYELGWVVGPRLNASGRIADPSKSLKLLMGENVESLSKELNELNNTRQDHTKQMYEEAVSGVSNGKFSGLDINDRVCISHSKDFHEGVIGLIASRLTKNLSKPSFVISWEGEFGKGSCRSVNGVSVVSLLEKVSGYLDNFGGHQMAAGFSLNRKNYKDFERELLDAAKKQIDPSLLEPTIYYDYNVPAGLLTYDLLDFIDKLEPFGNGNSEPLFVLKNTQIDQFKIMGQSGDHLSFNIPSVNVRAVYFGGGKVLNKLTSVDSYDLLFNFQKNEWKGSVYPQLMIKDLRASEF